MLKNTNFDFVTDESAYFVLSAWHELFHGFTPDSSQPRLHNVPSLVRELVGIAGHRLSEPRFQIHIKKIKKELAQSAQREHDILSCMPEYYSRCVSLTLEETSTEAIIAGGKILIQFENEYWECFQTLAKKAIDSLPSNKTEAFLFIRRLATFAFQDGKEDDDVWKPFENCERQTACELFEQMVHFSKQPAQKYRITLATIGDRAGMHSIARFRGFGVVSPKLLNEDFLKKVGSPNFATLYIQLSIKSKSIRNAVAIARRKIGCDIGLVSLYKSPDEGIRIHSTALVECDSEATTFLQTEQAFRRFHKRRKAQQRIKLADQLISESPVVDQRLLAATRQLALASASADNRTRFVNMWAALETLAGAHEGATAIERVTESIVPLMISRHVHRTTRYLTILADRYVNQQKEEDLGPGLSRLPKRRVPQDQMLLTLASPNKDPKIAGLLTAIKDPYFRFKIYQAWKVFHNPKEVKKQLEKSKRRLSWHLARIYRERNLLVHQGIETEYITPLLDNLQNYLVTLVQRIIHELQANPEWSIRQIIEYWNGRMNHVLDSLGKEECLLQTSDFLEDIVDPCPVWPVPDNLDSIE